VRYYERVNTQETFGRVRLPVPLEAIESRIHIIRGQKVMLDSDLAELCRVATGDLNGGVRRNSRRFPEDFMFQLTEEEFKNLRLHTAISSLGYGGRRYAPYAFTEHGVAMLSSVLRSERAVQMNISIIRAFMKLRQIVAGHAALSRRIEKIESTQKDHGSILSVVINDIEALSKNASKEFSRLSKPRKKATQIGFHIPARKRA
jgi:hypothetical protein